MNRNGGNNLTGLSTDTIKPSTRRSSARAPPASLCRISACIWGFHLSREVYPSLEYYREGNGDQEKAIWGHPCVVLCPPQTQFPPQRKAWDGKFEGPRNTTGHAKAGGSAGVAGLCEKSSLQTWCHPDPSEPQGEKFHPQCPELLLRPRTKLAKPFLTLLLSSPVNTWR